MNNTPFAYSVSDIHVDYDELDGNFYVFRSLKDLINYLENGRGVYPSELLDNYKYKLESHCDSGRKTIPPEDLIEKIEVTQDILDKAEELVEAMIRKQEEEDRKFLKENPGERLLRFSGIFYPYRKDKQKYIEQYLKNKSWKWKI